MRTRFDSSNGAAYDPSYRVSITDFEPQPNGFRYPYWLTDISADHDGSTHDDPAAHYAAYHDHATINPSGLNRAPYQPDSRFLFGLRD